MSWCIPIIDRKKLLPAAVVSWPYKIYIINKSFAITINNHIFIKRAYLKHNRVHLFFNLLVGDYDTALGAF